MVLAVLGSVSSQTNSSEVIQSQAVPNQESDAINPFNFIESITGVSTTSNEYVPIPESAYVKTGSAGVFDQILDSSKSAHHSKLKDLKVTIDGYSCEELIDAYDTQTAWTLRPYVKALIEDKMC